MEPGVPPATTIVLEGDRIVAVGPATLTERWPGAEVIDLGARTVAPGLIDAHNHLSVAALHPLWTDASGVSSSEALRDRFRATRQSTEDVNGWVRAFGWDDGKVLLARGDLDEIEPDRPAIVVHFSLHQCVVNSAALEELGISSSTPDPAGGGIARDSAGRPSGGLLERAWSEAHARSLAGYTEPDRWGELIERRCRTLLQEGVTALHDAACSPAAEAVYASLAAQGRLPIGVVANPHPAALLSELDPARLDGPPTGEGSEQFRIGPVKLFADGGAQPGVVGHLGGEPVQLGMTFGPIHHQIEAAADRGFGVAVHVMGNAMMDEVLDAFGRVADRAPMLRIEHATLASTEHIERMASQGVVAVVQPGFVPLLGALVEGYELDEATWMPFRSLLDAGVTLAGSSDDPCDVNWQPLTAAVRGVSRMLPSGRLLGPDQTVGYADWLHAYTRGSAIAGGQSNERGVLRPGTRADLVVLDGSLDADEPPRVAQTWIGGRVVYDAAAPAETSGARSTSSTDNPSTA